MGGGDGVGGGAGVGGVGGGAGVVDKAGVAGAKARGVAVGDRVESEWMGTPGGTCVDDGATSEPPWPPCAGACVVDA